MAACRGLLGAVRLLLDEGAEVDLCSEEGASRVRVQPLPIGMVLLKLDTPVSWAPAGQLRCSGPENPETCPGISGLGSRVTQAGAPGLSEVLVLVTVLESRSSLISFGQVSD